MKKFIAILTSLLLLSTSAFAGKDFTIDSFKGLQRSPNPEYIEDAAFTKLDNFYIKNKHLNVVKGRQKLNASANSNTTINMLCYYENAAGTTKKLVVEENTVLASYDTSGGTRTVLNTGFTNEQHTCKQVGDTLYVTSLTDGLYKWTGSGAATVITGPSDPSSVNFSGTSGFGGLTPGLDAVVGLIPKNTCSTCYKFESGTCHSTQQQFGYTTANHQVNASTCGGLSSTYFNTTCATSATYKYKVTKWNSILGIESNASSSDDATLTGSDAITVTLKSPDMDWSNNTCGSAVETAFQDADIVYSGKQTKASGTLAAAPSAPFDGYCVYRSVSGGQSYFKVDCVNSGFSASYVDGKEDTQLLLPLDTTIQTQDPPKSTFIEEYKGALFLAQGSTVYFTRLPVQSTSSADTYWLKTDFLVTGVKDPITGLKSTENSLLIFTNNRILELTGFGFSSFRLKTLYNSIGAISQNSIQLTNDGSVIIFAGTAGVFKIKLGQPITDNKIGSILDTNKAQIENISGPLDDTFRGKDTSLVLDPSTYTTSVAYYDTDRNRYFLYMGTECLMYDEDNKAWTHIPGVKSTAAIYSKSPGSLGQAVLTDDLGFMYNNWYGYTNGGPGSGRLTGSPTSSTGSTLTDSGATFYTTGSGLAGVWVIKDNGTTLEYRQITSNTATALTVATSWTANPVTTDTYYIGYIIPDATTKMYSLAKPPGQSTIQSVSILHNKSDSSQTLYISLSYKNESTTFTSTTDSFDLTTYFIDKRGINALGNWIQLNMRSYVTNTSDTISVPVDIISYNLFGVGVESE